MNAATDWKTTANSTQKHEIWLEIPAVYNPGEWRLSKQITGPRGGKKWQRVTHGIAATGGDQQMFLSAGLYKETWWSNGWPTSRQFTVNEDGTVDEN